LQEEPNCEELKALTTLTGISTPEIRELVETHCVILKKSKRSLKNKQKLQKWLKHTKINSSLYYWIYPKTYDNRPYSIKTKWNIKPFLGNVDFDSETHKIGKRQLAFHTEDIQIAAGNIYLPPELRFIIGRTYWLNQQSLSDSTGAVFSRRNLPNGLSIRYPGSSFSLEGYGTWNKNKHEKDTIDAFTYGLLACFTTSRAGFSLHSNINRFEFNNRDTETNLVNGLRIKENIFNLFHIGLAHSWNSGIDTGSNNQIENHLYGETGVNTPENKSSIRLFQASKEWTNPLMDFTSRTSDTTAGSIRIKGRGEGGLHLSSKFPLYVLEPGQILHSALKGKLNISTVIHWSLVDTDFQYRRLTFMVHNRFNNLHYKIGMHSTVTDSSKFLTYKNRLHYKPGSYIFVLAYSHKTGHYRGTYPRTLELHTGLTLPGPYRIKAKWLSRDVRNFQRYIDVLILQRWTLSTTFSLDWSIKLPFEDWSLSRDMYYQGKFHAKL
jgi:hypothetical protein